MLPFPRRSVDLSIPLDPHGPQPGAYGALPASAAPYSGDGFTLDVSKGGSCNCEVWNTRPPPASYSSRPWKVGMFGSQKIPFATTR